MSSPITRAGRRGTCSSPAARLLALLRQSRTPEELLPAAYDLARRFTANRSPVATALARQMMYRNSAQPHPLEAHRIDSLAMFYTSRGDGPSGASGAADVGRVIASTKADRMIGRDQVIAILGEISSASGLAISQVASREKIPFIQTGCNSDELRGKACNRYMFHIEGANTMYINAVGDSLKREDLVKDKKWFGLTADYAYVRLRDEGYTADDIGRWAETIARATAG